MAKTKTITLEEKLHAVKIDEAIIQNDRHVSWTKFRNQYSDLIFAEKRNTFIYGFILGAILMFIFLMSIASI